MASPYPKPTKLKKLEGNPGCRPLPENEPEFDEVSDIRPPEWLLGDNESNLFEKLAPQLQKNGLLTEANLDVLAMYCAMFGKVIRSTHDEGFDWTAAREVRLLAREFGFTPSSQAGVQARTVKKASKFSSAPQLRPVSA